MAAAPPKNTQRVVQPQFMANRILLKVSGEGLTADNNPILDINKVNILMEQIKVLVSKGIQVAIVIGGGNILRGSKASNTYITRSARDDMGMLATVLNGVALNDIFNNNGLSSSLFSAIEMNKITNFYNVSKVIAALNNKEVIVLTGGIANPYVTTDTTAVIRALELNCKAVYKGTQVTGVFTADPKMNPQAKKLNTVTYDFIMENKLQIMDLTAIDIAKNSNLPIYIFNMHTPNAILNVVNEQGNYSVIAN